MLSLIKLNAQTDNQIKPGEIKNIIFDLGGVIINIHYTATIEAFKKAGFRNFHEIYSQIKQSNLFDQIETGRIEPQFFRNELKKYHSLTDAEIDAAWNAMIGSMPAENAKLVTELRKQYRTFLLSNTNAIHIDFFYQYLQKEFGRNPLPEMFEKTYYSHDIHERKPNVSAYQYVLNHAGINASETLFIDDLIANVEGARKAGLHAYHLVNETISDLFTAE